MGTLRIVDELLKSDEPSVRWKVRAKVLSEDPGTKSMRALQAEIRGSPRVRKLLAPRNSTGRFPSAVYAKWQGAHWVLATLADIGYPPGDVSLRPMCDQVLEYWLADFFYQEFAVEKKSDAYKKKGVPVMCGRYRRCASQQGNTLFYLTRLGLTDKRLAQLVERLLHWQWPDGGWNCDKNPAADTSSFMESLLPMCGLAVYSAATANAKARAAAILAAEVFLSRRLFKRRSDSQVIHREFTSLHYPLYWHYDILGGLKAMAVVGLIRDPRCVDALELLESKQLSDGGWPAEKRYYTQRAGRALGSDFVDWGGTNQKRMNPWVTTDALAVLHAAGRI